MHYELTLRALSATGGNLQEHGTSTAQCGMTVRQKPRTSELRFGVDEKISDCQSSVVVVVRVRALNKV